LAEVLLYIEAATELVADYQPGDTYYRCCFVLCGEMYSAEEVDVADATVMMTLAPRVRIPTDEGGLLLAAALPELLFPVQFVAAWSELFSPSTFFWPVVLA
jgi:hypothetical protein